MVYKGRKPIYTSEKIVTRDNVVEVIQEAKKIHDFNAAAMRYLFDYEGGQQPILGRIKEVRPEINNKIVENHAFEIVDFKVSYCFGSPLTYVQRNEDNAEEIKALNEMMFEESKASKDQQLARDFNICGVGYRMVLPKDRIKATSPFDLIHLNPMTTFVVRSADVKHRPLCAATFYIGDDNVIHMGVYTDTTYFELEGINGLLEVKESAPNGIGKIPIIEYLNSYDRVGCFERVLPLLDALNNCTSDRLNGLAQFIQSFIWLNNVELDKNQKEELQAGGMLLTKNVDGSTNEAKVEYLTSQLNQTEVQTLADYLYSQILQIVGIPGRESNTGGDTGSAVSMRNGWEVAESKAKATEMIFNESERELLDVVLEIIRRSNVSFPELSLSDIDIKFSRNRTDSLLVKTQGLNNLLSAGVYPLDALSIVGLYSDPQQVWKNSEEYMEKWKASKEEKVMNDSGTQQQELKEVTE